MQAYIASLEPWQAAIAKRADALVLKHVSGVRKAVKRHGPFYGGEGQGCFLAFAAFRIMLSTVSSREPRSSPFRPSANSRKCAPWMCGSRTKSTVAFTLLGIRWASRLSARLGNRILLPIFLHLHLNGGQKIEPHSIA